MKTANFFYNMNRVNDLNKKLGEIRVELRNVNDNLKQMRRTRIALEKLLTKSRESQKDQICIYACIKKLQTAEENCLNMSHRRQELVRQRNAIEMELLHFCEAQGGGRYVQIGDILYARDYERTGMKVIVTEGFGLDERETMWLAQTLDQEHNFCIDKSQVNISDFFTTPDKAHEAYEIIEKTKTKYLAQKRNGI